MSPLSSLTATQASASRWVVKKLTRGQAMLDSLADKEDPFADTPWIADQLGLAIRGALGCGDVEKA
jgi:hypothetical protein